MTYPFQKILFAVKLLNIFTEVSEVKEVNEFKEVKGRYLLDAVCYLAGDSAARTIVL